MSAIKPLTVGIDRSLSSCLPEVKYVFRTLLRIAGYPYLFRWADELGDGATMDIYYGPLREDCSAAVQIRASKRDIAAAPGAEPHRLDEQEGIHFLEFGNKDTVSFYRENGRLVFLNDIVFAGFWLLSGARESQYPRDRRDNIILEGSFFLENKLASRPIVSVYGAFLRKFFTERGMVPLGLPWAPNTDRVAFSYTHDVDYPQILRLIECARLGVTQGIDGVRTAIKVLKGNSHFWKFSDWVSLADRTGGHPTFYFMAHQGSLLKYALGTPDGFYDIHTTDFRLLFEDLRESGCEIGLHASYNAYQSVEHLKLEKQHLEDASGVEVEGNRHHYWHLDPSAPYETLHKLEQAGFKYDSSLAFEFVPGFRRGICHPYRVYHPGLRRELKPVELPPSWMDDHFDRRLVNNGILDPVGYAAELVQAARSTGGATIVDYHVRGMNGDFFPHYGPWLANFMQERLNGSTICHRPIDLAEMYLAYEDRLESNSCDMMETDQNSITYVPGGQNSDKSSLQPGSIGLLNASEEKYWGAFVESHPHGNVYHTLAWKRVTEEGLGHRPYYLRGIEATGKVLGVLPLFLVDGIFGKRLVSVPMRDRAGLIAQDTEVASLLLKKAIDLTREMDCRYLEIRSLHELDPLLVKEYALRSERYWITSRIDLTPGKEHLWKALDKKAVRWAIKKADKLGVQVKLDDTKKGIDTFYELFARTRRSMGIPPFPRQHFMAIWRNMILKGRANLFLAWKDDEPINGMINLFSKEAFIPAYAAPQQAWLKHYPSEVMIWHTIEWAVEQGFKVYDFGADSPTQTGLLWFKKKWGAVQQPTFTYYYLNGHATPPNFDSSTPTYRLLRKVWAGLPMPLCKSLGSLVTRQLS